MNEMESIASRLVGTWIAVPDFEGQESSYMRFFADLRFIVIIKRWPVSEKRPWQAVRYFAELESESMLSSYWKTTSSRLSSRLFRKFHFEGDTLIIDVTTHDKSEKPGAVRKCFHCVKVEPEGLPDGVEAEFARATELPWP